MIDRIAEARNRWRTEQHLYKAFGDCVQDRIRAALTANGIQPHIEARPKDEVTLVRKLILKPEHSYDSLGDKLGVRVIVSHRDDAARVATLMHDCFECRDEEDTAQRLGTKQLGYRGLHMFLLLKEGDPKWMEFRHLKAELQVHTEAQHLWATMEHPIYKLEPYIPPDLVRRMHLLAGLLEVADDEFLRIEREIAVSPGMEAVPILEALERLYVKLVGSEWDRELSLDVVRHLLPLYAPESALDIVKSFDDLYMSEAAHLEMIITREKKSDLERSAFILQPEALMIYGLLKKDRYSLRRKWNLRFPDDELERFALAFGIVL